MQDRSGLEKERGDRKARERIARRRFCGGSGGENLREDENQEGKRFLGVTLTGNPEKRLLSGKKALETTYPETSEAS